MSVCLLVNIINICTQWTIIYHEKQKNNETCKHLKEIVVQNDSTFTHCHKPGYLNLSNNIPKKFISSKYDVINYLKVIGVFFFKILC